MLLHLLPCKEIPLLAFPLRKQETEARQRGDCPRLSTALPGEGLPRTSREYSQASGCLLRAASIGAGIYSKENPLTTPGTGGSVWQDSEPLTNPATQSSQVSWECCVQKSGPPRAKLWSMHSNYSVNVNCKAYDKKKKKKSSKKVRNSLNLLKREGGQRRKKTA